MNKKLFALFLAFAAFLVFGLTPSAHADLFPWGSGNIITVTDPSPSPGQDIRQVLFGADTGSYYFRIDLAGAPVLSDTGTWYGIYLGLPGNVVTSPTGADFALEAGFRNFGGSPVFTPTFTDLRTHSASAARFLENFAAGGNILEWQISREALQSEWISAMGTAAAQEAFSFLAATLDPRGIVLDSTATTVTPLPGAAWLLASGMVAFVGLRRKSR